MIYDNIDFMFISAVISRYQRICGFDYDDIDDSVNIILIPRYILSLCLLSAGTPLYLWTWCRSCYMWHHYDVVFIFYVSRDSTLSVDMYSLLLWDDIIIFSFFMSAGIPLCLWTWSRSQKNQKMKRKRNRRRRKVCLSWWCFKTKIETCVTI